MAVLFSERDYQTLIPMAGRSCAIARSEPSMARADQPKDCCAQYPPMMEPW